MRKIDLIVIHCSASLPKHDIGVEEITQMHLNRGWSDVGYHFIIKQDGTIEVGRPIESIGAHALGYNRNSVGVCYVGGLDENGKASDTRTDEQIIALEELINDLLAQFTEVLEIKGHRDLSPDLDGDGIIERHEWLKQCPCFDAIGEYQCKIV
jgi:N-acetylmuramoyl-L-alanine amidase